MYLKSNVILVLVFYTRKTRIVFNMEITTNGKGSHNHQLHTQALLFVPMTSALANFN